MTEDHRIIGEEREKRKTWLRRIHESHPILAFAFVDLAGFLAVVVLVWLLPFVRVRWSTVALLLVVTFVGWLVLVFETPPRAFAGKRR